MKIITLLLIACFLILPTQAHAIRLMTFGFEQQTVTAGEEFSSNGINGCCGEGIDTTTFRSGLASLKLSADGTARFTWVGHVPYSTATTNKVFIRAYVYITDLPATGNVDLIAAFNTVGPTRQAGIALQSDGTLLLKGWDSSTIDSASSALSLNTWYRIEMEYQSGAGTGTVRAYIDGTEFAGDTAQTSSNFDAAYFGTANGSDSSWTVYWDDIAINDTATTNSSTQTGLPGAGSIVMLKPTANGDSNPEGCNNTSPCADTSTYWQYIDDTNPDDATTFVDVDTAINADFAMTDSSTAGIDSYDTITLIHVFARRREEIAAATLFHLRVKSASGGAVWQTGDNDNGNTTWRTNATGGNNFMLQRLATTTDPTTKTAWTPTGTNSIDNLQAGFGISDSDDVDVSTLWVNVEYVDGSPPATPETRRVPLIIIE